jgi:serine protease Do
MTVGRSTVAARGRRSTVLLVAGLVGAGTVLVPAPAAAGNNIGQAEKSILLLEIGWQGYVQYPNTSGALSWSDAVTATASCTGWFASPEGHIVTAGHCVDPAEGKTALLHTFLQDNDALDLEAQAQANWRVEGLQQGSAPERTVQAVQPPAVQGTVITTPITLEVLDFQAFTGGDVALLKANGLPGSSPALSIATQSPAIGDPVTAIGFPGAVLQVADVSRIRASFKSGTVSSTQIMPSGAARTEINADMSPGMSGGPTIDDQGHVLGVNSATASGSTRNFNFITDQAALRTYLEQQQVTPITPAPVGPSLGRTAAPPPSAGLPMWVWIVGGLALVLVLVTGLVLLLRRRPAPAAAGGPGGSPPQPTWGQGGIPAQPTGTPPAGASVGAPVGAPVDRPAGGNTCTHAGTPPTARFCQDCGSEIARQPR